MKKYSDLVCVLIFISLNVVMLTMPNELKGSIKQALRICVTSIIPSLFPFMIISQIFSRTGIASKAGKCLSFIISPILGISKELCGAFLMGVFGGFPIGAHSAGIIYQNKLCSKEEAERCIAISNCFSAPFLITIAGMTALGSLKNGIILFISQLICIIIVSNILRIMYGNRNNCCYAVSESKLRIRSYSSIICKSITESCTSILNVCGFITVFYTFSNVMMTKVQNRLFLAISKGLLEATSGILSSESIRFPKNFLLVSFIIGFSGMSVILQVTDAAAKYNLSSKEFIISRLLGCVLMPIITTVALLFLPQNAVSVFNPYLPYHPYYPSSNINMTSAVILYVLSTALVLLVLAIIYSVCCLCERKQKRQKH